MLGMPAMCGVQVSSKRNLKGPAGVASDWGVTCSKQWGVRAIKKGLSAHHVFRRRAWKATRNCQERASHASALQHTQHN